MSIRNSAGRRERAKEHARRDILLAAAGVFAKRGYAAATLQELAEAAGFAAPSLYRYFESKEEIFRSLVGLVIREMDATFEVPADRARPLGARLEDLLLSQARIAESLGPAIELLKSGGPDLGVAIPELACPRAGLAFYEERLAAWLRKNAAASELRHPPEIVARAFAGIAFAFRDDGAHTGLPEPARTRLVVDLALQGFAAPAERRRGAA